MSVASTLPWLGFLLTGALALICTVVGILLHDSRVSVYRNASGQAANLSAIISQDIERNIDFLDLSMQGVIDDLKIPAAMASPVELRRLILFDRAATAPYLGPIRVLDTSGNITIDSREATPRQVNFADRDYFRAHVEHQDLGLFISKPLISRTDGRMIVALSRRVDNADGSFGGVVVGTVYLDYFRQLFARTKLGLNGSLTLFRGDGTVLMREPFTDAVGKTIRPPELFERLARAPEGEYQAKSAVDGVERLIHYRKIEALPLVQDVALSVEDIYADWWGKATGIVAVLALCCAIILGLAVWLRRELRRRAEAEAALVLLAEEDGLTGLANRRRFDKTLRAEWDRAERHGTLLSLLMVDADQFKAFNDILGHLAGDEALRALGSCLRSHIRRSGELAARYGGEEFAVILPMVTSSEAINLAEKLRTAILGLAIAHPGSTRGVFTVSIGVATCHPTEKTDRLELVAAADAALYASKARGRNHSSAEVPALRHVA